MSRGITAVVEYEILDLTCDQEAFARLRELIMREPSVAAVLGGTSAAASASAIHIHPPFEPQPTRWTDKVLLAVGVAFSILLLIPTFVGAVSILRWLGVL